jgi:hypothetical protein
MGCPRESTLVEVVEGTAPDGAVQRTLDHAERCHVCRKALVELIRARGGTAPSDQGDGG